MPKPLSEMTVLVTGGSRGIGAAVAERFAMIGMNVIIHYLEAHEAANETARRCMAHGARVLTISADIGCKDEIAKMYHKLQELQLLPDILVNNAGIAHYGLLSDTSEAEWDKVMNINLKGMFLCTQMFMPHMVSQKFGRIINVSSIWGQTGASYEVVYATAKGGVNAFTKSLAKELAPSEVTVNAVAPGAVDTEMLDDITSDDQQLIKDDIPAGRFAQPHEIASLVYFIALPESGYITGQIISPNGGWMT